MLSFIQLNLIHVMTFLTLVVVWGICVMLAPKEAFKIITGVVAVLMLGVIGSTLHNTLYNQVPKREIDRSYVDQGTMKYQQSLHEVAAPNNSSSNNNH